MSDQTIIDAAADVQRGPGGIMITDLQARVVANAWHGGQWSALYAFASTGSICNGERDPHGRDLRDEIDDCRNAARHASSLPYHEPDELALIALDVYVKDAGERGPVPGWGELHW